jgi:hypothetical protein
MQWARRSWAAVAAFLSAVGPKKVSALVVWTVLSAVALIILIFALAGFIVDEVALDRRSVRTDATVIETHSGKVGLARVRFSSARSTATEATIQYLPFSDLPTPGDRVAIEYDPDRPDRARRVGAHDLLVPISFWAAVAAASTYAIRRKPPQRRRRRS